MTRADGRDLNQLRPVSITPGYLTYPEGSVLIETGNTRVVCAATAEEGVPPHLEGRNRGWVTAEYSMLPRATQRRTPRESRTSGIRGRSYEIQRLVGRALRAAVNLDGLPGWTFIVDCDVIQADAGTRTASITGGYVALRIAIEEMVRRGVFDAAPVVAPVAAVSVGISGGLPMLDLDYVEDSQAEVDLNVAANSRGQLIEVQGTAEGEPFDQSQLQEMLKMAEAGLLQLFAAQRRALQDAAVPLGPAET